MQSTSHKPLKPISFGKRSHQQTVRGAQLLRNPDTDIEKLPQEVRQYLKSERVDKLGTVAQWSVDNDESKLLRALYDDGFRGPIAVKKLQSECVTAVLLELNKLPLNPLAVRLEFDQRIEPQHALRLAQLLRSNNLCIRGLRLDLSSQLTPQELRDLMSAVNLLYDLQALDLLVDGQQQAPIAEHVVSALVECRQALVLSGETILPMVMKHWEDFQSDGEACVELKDLVQAIVSQVRATSAPSPRQEGFLLFRLALSYGEYAMLRALATLGLAPPPGGHIQLLNHFPDREARALLEQWSLSFALKAHPGTSERLDGIGEWLEQRPGVDQMALSLNGAMQKAHLQRLADAVAGLGSPFKRLTLALGSGFSMVQAPDAAPPGHEDEGRVPLLRLELTQAVSPQHLDYSVEVVRLIRLMKPQRLELMVPLTSVALRLFDACGEHSHFAPMSLMHIECLRSDRPADMSIETLQRFFKQPHKIARFVFDGAPYQWDNGSRQAVQSIPSTTVWLMEISLTQLNAKQQRVEWWRGKAADVARSQFWQFKAEHADVRAAADAFFGLHLNRHFSDEMGRRIIRGGGLSGRDRLALSLVSTGTQEALRKARCDILAKAVLAGQLDAGGLQLLLVEGSTGQRDLRLVALLESHFKERIEQARKAQLASLASLEAAASLLLKEQALWSWQEEARQNKQGMAQQQPPLL